jgi:hypothetical protein
MEDSRIPFLITEVNGSRILLDRSSGQEKRPGKRAALLTVTPSPNNALWIQGTDSDAVLKLTNSLIQEHSFPASLNRALSQKLPAELVMSIDENGLCTTRIYGPIS